MPTEKERHPAWMRWLAKLGQELSEPGNSQSSMEVNLLSSYLSPDGLRRTLGRGPRFKGSEPSRICLKPKMFQLGNETRALLTGRAIKLNIDSGKVDDNTAAPGLRNLADLEIGKPDSRRFYLTALSDYSFLDHVRKFCPPGVT